VWTRCALFVLVACSSAQANESRSDSDQWNACLNQEYRPAKIAACAEVLRDSGLTTERLTTALFHHALGLISMMLLKPATDDLAAILALDPQSEFATTRGR
jgi:hypothetical protein